MSVVGLSTYLILMGIYSSAISFSKDAKLRQSIRNLTLNELKLLGGIGDAHMLQEIQKKVITAAKSEQARMAEQVGPQSSLDEIEMNEYLNEVIKEIQSRKEG